MLETASKPEQLVKLLASVRAAGAHELADFEAQIAQSIPESKPAEAVVPPQPAAEPKPGLWTRLTRFLTGVRVEQPPPVVPGVPSESLTRAKLLAYHEILAYDRAGAVTGQAANVAEATHQLNEIYLHALRFDVARALLEKYVKRWPKARPLRVVMPLLGDNDGPVDDFRDSKALEVQVVAKPGATTTFVVFCGVRNAFGIQLNVLHHCNLARHNVNVVYLRDFQQNLYLAGIKSVGDLQQTLAGLRDIFAKLNTRKLVFLGNSGGVFGALYYGALLNGNLMLLFGGPSSLERGLEASERQSYPRILALHKEGKAEWPNLRDIYANNGKPVWYYFSDAHEVDSLQARNMAGLENVDLRPVHCQFHFMINRIAKSGEWQRALALAAAPLP